MKSKKIIIGIVLILSAIFMSAIGTNKAIAGDSFFSDLSEEKKYDWIVRARLMGIFPSGDSTALNPVSTALGGPAELSAKDWYIPELDITYMVTKHIGVELILGVSQHDISSKGTLAPLSPGVVADTWLLPPTLLLQYHFNPDGKFRPYVGVGLNVTFAFGAEVKPVLTTGTGLTSVDIDTSVGIALQAGFDYEINEEPRGIKTSFFFGCLIILASSFISLAPQKNKSIAVVVSPWAEQHHIINVITSAGGVIKTQDAIH